MIDLHLHLDGSLPPGLLLELAGLEGVALPADTEEGLRPYLTVPPECQSLGAFLERFALPVSCMQSVATLSRAASGLVEELAQQGLLYADIRFAPHLHLQKGLTQEQVVRAVICGIEKGQEGNAIKTGLLLCCMRGADNKEANEETVRLAAAFLGQGVSGIDLAGAEALYPTRDFAPLFALASRLQVPFTVHAGEADGPEGVREALSWGARRLGHGVRAAEDPSLLEEIKREKITLEVCVTSNLQTGAVPPGTVHPILSLLRQGVRVTVNTDDMTVCGTTLARELALLREMGMTGEEEQRLFENALEAAFITEEERASLQQQLDAAFERRKGGCGPAI